jgi:hypothetical protein
MIDQYEPIGRPKQAGRQLIEETINHTKKGQRITHRLCNPSNLNPTSTKTNKTDLGVLKLSS